MGSLTAALAVATACLVSLCSGSLQTHLSLTLDPSVVAVTFVTDTSTSGLPTCVYGTSAQYMNKKAEGTSHTYPDGGFNGSIHVVSLPYLLPLTVYYYQCEVDEAETPLFSFTSSSPKAHNTTISIVGDMGITNSAKTMELMGNDVVNGSTKLSLHVGDISYADDRASPNSAIWDEFFSRMETTAASAPYMTGPGNHDAQYNFAAYRNRLTMPEAGNGAADAPFYYSFDFAGIHFVMMSTEHNFSRGSAQNEWLEKDLALANQNRANVPWIIVTGHRPLYCSGAAGTLLGRCTTEAEKHREAVEDLLHTYGVELYICGHNHQYERTAPVYNNTKVSDSYDNPTATTYIVNGSGGNTELEDPFFFPNPGWRMAGNGFFGYVRMEVTFTEVQAQLGVSFIRDDTGKAVDEFTITKPL